MAEEPPTGDRAVFAFLELVALAFMFEGVSAFLNGKSVWELLGCATAALCFFLGGVKWPLIRAKLGGLRWPIVLIALAGFVWLVLFLRKIPMPLPGILARIEYASAANGTPTGKMNLAVLLYVISLKNSGPPSIVSNFSCAVLIRDEKVTGEIFAFPLDKDGAGIYDDGQVEWFDRADWIYEKTARQPLSTGAQEFGRVGCQLPEGIPVARLDSTQTTFELAYRDVSGALHFAFGRWAKRPSHNYEHISFPGLRMDPPSSWSPTDKGMSTVLVTFGGLVRELKPISIHLDANGKGEATFPPCN